MLASISFEGEHKCARGKVTKVDLRLVGMCLSHTHVAVITHHNPGNLQKEWLLGFQLQRVRMHHGREGSMAAGCGHAYGNSQLQLQAGNREMVE